MVCFQWHKKNLQNLSLLQLFENRSSDRQTDRQKRWMSDDRELSEIDMSPSDKDREDEKRMRG